MKFIMDMVHDNPGEKRCDTSFRHPEKLQKFGYNGKVFKNINSIVTFEKLGKNYFPGESGGRWIAEMQEILQKEITEAHKNGLWVINHTDLFVLPSALTAEYKEEICDENGKISIFRDMTKELHKILFDEMFDRYSVDGIMIRVGETYLHDTPYHIGNGAVKYGDKEDEKKAFVELLRFLREEICVKRDKYLLFRTWDCFPDRFHADLDYYLAITNEIEPHENLVFSIKHTALDFWRNVKFNPCLGKGKHRQIVEVQCQREYEGKGAYPMYVMDGVINGFPENRIKIGLKDIADNELICGIFSWSRGGGWKGPYLQNEFWCELNTYVISAYAANPQRSEKDIFLEYTSNYMGMDMENGQRFHQICLRVQDAVLHGRYIAAYDKSLNENLMPCANWLRDDRMGGLNQLNDVFQYLEDNDLVEQAISEKALSVSIWCEIKERFRDVIMPDAALYDFINNSIEYAIRFFTIAHIAFQIMAKCRKQENVAALLEAYDHAWYEFKKLESRKDASTSYCEEYLDDAGLSETIAYCRKKLC